MSPKPLVLRVHEGSLSFFPCAVDNTVVRVKGLPREREAGDDWRGLLLRPVKQIRAAFLDWLAVQTV